VLAWASAYGGYGGSKRSVKKKSKAYMLSLKPWHSFVSTILYYDIKPTARS
jgi:hypothetical protein